MIFVIIAQKIHHFGEMVDLKSGRIYEKKFYHSFVILIIYPQFVKSRCTFFEFYLKNL